MEDSSSIFGGIEKKDGSRQLAGEEGRDRDVMMMTASSRSGFGDPILAAATVPVTMGSSERMTEVDETPVDR